jgi:ubiquinone/menaquinone biosynthesis C-methylase UbiE
MRYVDGRADGLPGVAHIPRNLLHGVAGKDVLCLASGGGQQTAVFGLLGADVTSLDICEGQLAGDRIAADHYGYPISTVKGDMRDLSVFADECFDLVFQEVSIVFVPDVREVYREVHRVLRPGGSYFVDHCNPATFPTCFEGGDNGWDGTAYRIAEPYIGGPILKTASGTENMTEGEPIGEYRHLLIDIFGGLTELEFHIQEVAESPRHLVGGVVGEPGSHDHHNSIVAQYFRIVSVKE